jgi:serine phosphatase RsbU (regulator of sigma subunit)
VLGQLGWAEWDLVQDRIEWSDHLYAILGRDRGDGPVRFDRLDGVVEPADVARLKSAITTLTTAGTGGDLRIRVHLSGERRHIRLVMQVVRDTGGRALKMSFLVQDVTAIEQAQLRVADVERQLVERQRSQEAEHRVAQELRHIILPLPAAPVCLPGLQVAVRYLPAEEASLIGGDWYDASALPSGGALLAVGDVAGHGLASAATMAELRHALKTLTITGSAEPGFLVGGLNRLLCGGEAHPGRTGTVVIAHFDPGTAMLTWAQAGHPAPLLVRDGRVVELPRPYGVLLGANPDSRYETCATRLTSSDTLLLYTDGLVERRGGDCDAGLDDVTAALLSTLDREPAVSLTELLTRLPPANPTDDMCILVARATT